MEMLLLVGIFAAGVILFFNSFKGRKKNVAVTHLTDEEQSILQQHVPFYASLNEGGRLRFEERVKHFLSDISITGANATVEPMDRIFVAASAVIPTFGFEDWEYTNIDEVIIYPETFGEEFEQQGSDRSILGMVGWGVMNNTMIISQHDLRQGFLNKTGKTNTAIHEFVHLLDKSDGAVDGVPENLIDKQYIKPWISLVQKKITAMLKGKSDINIYGATNEAEFFAVASEYFFERPDLLKKKHPDLYALLEEVFRRKTISTEK
jgi:Mlc titration factor MtfA (ptsG expression regulator)